MTIQLESFYAHLLSHLRPIDIYICRVYILKHICHIYKIEKKGSCGCSISVSMLGLHSGCLGLNAGCSPLKLFYLIIFFAHILSRVYFGFSSSSSLLNRLSVQYPLPLKYLTTMLDQLSANFFLQFVSPKGDKDNCRLLQFTSHRPGFRPY